ncbi:hypothetical protein TGAMA5MH_06045 [Trichoderma gamsii]|uniref:Uncharacterized protein n=1 Tax=Trichoderma gamsii TaxID=398673 RepID=A0A2K0TA21_9HYPO|nr:hypothetical protein TGAMA5MH_06045 [Trichoderma gamsii]
MVVVGQPRDMNKWRDELLNQNVHLPNPSDEYRRARDELTQREEELRLLTEEVAAQRWALPPVVTSKKTTLSSLQRIGSKVKLSELFAPGKDALMIYNMMFPRWAEDKRVPVPVGETAELRLFEQPCPSSKTSPERLHNYGEDRG